MAANLYLERRNQSHSDTEYVWVVEERIGGGFKKGL